MVSWLIDVIEIIHNEDSTTKVIQQVNSNTINVHYLNYDLKKSKLGEKQPQ